MRIRVVGGESVASAWARSGCLVVDDLVAFDSGGLASQLSESEQVAIDHVLLTHAHLDHIGELAFLADNVMTLRSIPLKIWAPDPVLSQVRSHLFNNQLWPDFSRISIGDHPVVEFCPLVPNEAVTIGHLKIHPVRTSHPVFSVGYLIEADGVAILYTGDTGPTEAIWQLANQAAGLKAVFIETAFPERLDHLARASGHMTPRLLRDELDKLGNDGIQINVMHVKPVYHEEISSELQKLTRPWRIVTGGERFVYKN